MKYEVRDYGCGHHKQFAVWQVLPNGGENLVAVCVYKKGAMNVARLLNVYQDIMNKEVV